MQLRQATEQDANAIAKLHVQAWIDTYQDILAPAIIAAQDEQKRAKMWSNVLSKTHHVFVIEQDHTLLGFIGVGPSRAHDATPAEGELYAIYLHIGSQAQGLGKQLFDKGAETLRTLGFRSCSLWVLRDNARARRFYERQGMTLSGKTQYIERAEGALDEVQYIMTL